MFAYWIKILFFSHACFSFWIHQLFITFMTILEKLRWKPFKHLQFTFNFQVVVFFKSVIILNLKKFIYEIYQLILRILKYMKILKCVGCLLSKNILPLSKFKPNFCWCHNSSSASVLASLSKLLALYLPEIVTGWHSATDTFHNSFLFVLFIQIFAVRENSNLSNNTI